jgi:hypothetical protein
VSELDSAMEAVGFAEVGAARAEPGLRPEVLAVIFDLARDTLATYDRLKVSGWAMAEMPHEAEVHAALGHHLPGCHTSADPRAEDGCWGCGCWCHSRAALEAHGEPQLDGPFYGAGGGTEQLADDQFAHGEPQEGGDEGQTNARSVAGDKSHPAIHPAALASAASVVGSPSTGTRGRAMSGPLQAAARSMVWTLFARCQHDNEGHNLPAIERYFVRRWSRAALSGHHRGTTGLSVRIHAGSACATPS